MKPKVLVTGATGVLGSHLVKKLLLEGYKIVILKRSFSDTKRINDVISQLISYDIDKCDLAQPFQELGKIETIIHTATCYGRNQESVLNIFEANTLFPLRLLDIATYFKTDAFLNTDTILNKYLNDYSLSKKQFIEWGEQFAKRRKIRFVNIKLEHMYGPGDDDSKFTSYVIRSCLNNTKELKLTSGEQKRDFIYIDDVVSAYSILLSKTQQQEKFYQSYELGSGKAGSIREFVEIVHKITNSKTVLNFGALPYRENEIMQSEANIESLKNLGWSPKYALKDGLSKTILTEAQRLDVKRGKL